MDKDLEGRQTKRRKSLIDRLQKFSGDETVISKGKLSKIKDKLKGPVTHVNERFDEWGDDIDG